LSPVEGFLSDEWAGSEGRQLFPNPAGLFVLIAWGSPTVPSQRRNAQGTGGPSLDLSGNPAGKCRPAVALFQHGLGHADLQTPYREPYHAGEGCRETCHSVESNTSEHRQDGSPVAHHGPNGTQRQLLPRGMRSLSTPRAAPCSRAARRMDADKPTRSGSAWWSRLAETTALGLYGRRRTHHPALKPGRRQATTGGAVQACSQLPMQVFSSTLDAAAGRSRPTVPCPHLPRARATLPEILMPSLAAVFACR
jgi:hypothetical protein